ncbi:MAG: sialate O-acetylesterase [Planctomycetia bacterium]|nr:sialate O-acetylesterase [Planctomycetia bacterium]
MKKKFFATFVLTCAACAMTTAAMADVTVSKCFTDNAVFQRDKPIVVWGKADADEEVTVEFNNTSATTTACKQGNWKVELPACPASFEGKDLVIKGKNTLTFSNILVGEVWICSGQSNMEMPLNSWGQKLKGTDEPRLACTPEEINGDYSYIRFNRPVHAIKTEDQFDFDSPGWRVCKDGVQKDCTAAGFHFAVRLHEELNVPVGLIDSNWGGSNINSWIPDDGWNQVPETVDFGKQIIGMRPEMKDYDKPGGMYYAMLSPWKNYMFRGAIWYQGCTNAGEKEFYYYKQKAMIREWRKIFNNGDFPFYWVQLAPFTAIKDDPNDTGDWPYLRNGQTMCLEVANTGQAVIIDAGEVDDIHPTNKFIVGNRLALWALAQIFNKDVECCSPMVEKIDFEGAKATVVFNHVGAGLTVAQLNERVVEETPDAQLNTFAVAGTDGKYVWAKAKIVDKNKVEVSADGIDEITAVRYAWQMFPDKPNLYSKDGLPATPFRIKK